MGIKNRHSGRDCRNLEAMEGNSSLGKCLILVVSSPQFHIAVDWIPAIHAGMTGLQLLCITGSAERGNDKTMCLPLITVILQRFHVLKVIIIMTYKQAID